MDNWIETFRGVVYPWHCDHLGHMNVQHYVGMFDQASFHLTSALGFSYQDAAERGQTMVDVQHTVKYKREQAAGSLIKIESGIVEVGTKSITFLHRMSNTETGEVAATSEIVEVFFDLHTRKSRVMPDELREKLAELVVERE
jgi:acyl-CoA thioester hydrolase